eukprot:8002001-Karenia_brevis.AAC.1
MESAQIQIFQDLPTQDAKHVIMTVASDLLKVASKDNLVLFFRLADARQSSQQLCVAHTFGSSFDETQRILFQQRLLAMWWDTMLRTKKQASDVNQVLCSVPVPIMTHDTLMNLDAQETMTMDQSGYGLISILEVTFVRYLVIDWSRARMADR